MATSNRLPLVKDPATIKLRLRRYYRQLVHQLLPHILVPHLVQNGVLDISEADMVLAERGLLPQSARILALVERKEPRALVGFLGSLHQSNHHHIADILEMPNDAEHLDNDEVPTSMDAPDEMPRPWAGDSSVIDIRISMLPGHHGHLANVQPIITSVSPSPSTRGQSPSTPVPQPAAQQGLGAFSSAPSSGQFVSAPSNLPVSGGQPRYGGCPSPGCPCGDLQQSLLHTLCAAQQTLAGLYPLRSEQDVQMSAECRMTISQCLEMLQWLAAGGVHVQQVLQACVLLRATCQDVKALDSLLKWLRDGTLRRKLAVAYQLGDEPQSTLSFSAKINPIQYLLYREKLDISAKDCNEFRSQYPQAFLRRMGDDIDSQYYMQLVQCLLGKNEVRNALEFLWRTYQRKYCEGEAVLLHGDWIVQETEPTDSPEVIGSASFEKSVPPQPSKPSMDSSHLEGSAHTHNELTQGLCDIEDCIHFTYMLTNKLRIYRYTTYVFAKLIFSFTGQHGIKLPNDFVLDKFDSCKLRLSHCYPVPRMETTRMDQYLERLSTSLAPKRQLFEEYLPPLNLQMYFKQVWDSWHDLRKTVSEVQVELQEKREFKMLQRHHRVELKGLSQSLQQWRDAVQKLVVECGLEHELSAFGFKGLKGLKIR